MQAQEWQTQQWQAQQNKRRDYREAVCSNKIYIYWIAFGLSFAAIRLLSNKFGHKLPQVFNNLITHSILSMAVGDAVRSKVYWFKQEEGDDQKYMDAKKVVHLSKFLSEVVLPAVSATFLIYPYIAKKIPANNIVSSNLHYALFAMFAGISAYLTYKKNYNDYDDSLKKRNQSINFKIQFIKHAISTAFCVSMFCMMMGKSYNPKNILIFSFGIKTLYEFINVLPIETRAALVNKAMGAIGPVLQPTAAVKSIIGGTYRVLRKPSTFVKDMKYVIGNPEVQI